MRAVWASVLIPLAACGPPAQEEAGSAIRFAIEERELPAAFDRRGLGRPANGAPEGLWAVVAGLERPESALVRNLESGAAVTVPLFRGPASQDPADILLSPQAAAALGIAERPLPVRVTALRREPELIAGR